MHAIYTFSRTFGVYRDDIPIYIGGKPGSRSRSTSRRLDRVARFFACVFAFFFAFFVVRSLFFRSLFFVRARETTRVPCAPPCVVIPPRATRRRVRIGSLFFCSVSRALARRPGRSRSRRRRDVTSVSHSFTHSRVDSFIRSRVGPFDSSRADDGRSTTGRGVRR